MISAASCSLDGVQILRLVPSPSSSSFPAVLTSSRQQQDTPHNRFLRSRRSPEIPLRLDSEFQSVVSSMKLATTQLSLISLQRSFLSFSKIIKLALSQLLTSAIILFFPSSSYVALNLRS